jgi:hypothetical protein
MNAGIKTNRKNKSEKTIEHLPFNHLTINYKLTLNFKLSTFNFIVSPTSRAPSGLVCTPSVV